MSTPQLQMVERETWQREFVLRRLGDPLGQAGWEIEFALWPVDDRSMPLHTCTVANNRARWLAPGVVRVTISQQAVTAFDFDSAAFSLRVIDLTDVSEDPQGQAWVCIRGILDLQRVASATSNGMRQY